MPHFPLLFNSTSCDCELVYECLALGRSKAFPKKVVGNEGVLPIRKNPNNQNRFVQVASHFSQVW